MYFVHTGKTGNKKIVYNGFLFRGSFKTLNNDTGVTGGCYVRVTLMI